MGKPNPLNQLKEYADKLKEGFQGIQAGCEARHAECQERFEGVAMFAEILEEHEKRIEELEAHIRKNDSRDIIGKMIQNLSPEQIREMTLENVLADYLEKQSEE